MTNNIEESRGDRPRIDNEADRKAFVRDWIARRLGSSKAKTTGLAGSVLSLPALAVAQGQEGFVTAAEIEGVNSVEVMPDGSAQLEMANGATVAVPAQDVQVAGTGEVLVNARIVDIAAEVMAAGGGGAGIGGAALAGGLGVAGAAALAGGDDGGDGGGTPPPTINSQVLSAGGGLNNESTGVDVPEGTEDVEVTVTDEDGNETQLTGTVDDDGNWEADPDEEEDLPQGEVAVTVRSLDEDGEEIDSQSQDVIIDTVPPKIAITDTGVGADDVLNIAERDAGITISGTTDAEDGQEVTVTLSTAASDVVETTATANGGQWSVDIAGDDLAGIADGETVDVEATVEDAAGNPADSPATDKFDADLAGPDITIDDISDDNQIGLVDVNDADGLDVTGTTTAEAGQEVTLTLDGQEYTGTVSAVANGANTWAANVPQSALQALQDAAGGDDVLADIAVSAAVSDAAGNPAQTPATTTIDADFSGPSIAVDPITGDNVVNNAESGSDVTISGTTNNVGGGQTVSVTVDGKALPDVQTNSDGTWTATLPQTDAAALPDGGSVDVTADVTDPDGVAASSTVQLAADFTAPTVAIDTVSGDDVINAQEGGQPLTISGTSTGAAEGQEVTVGGLPNVPDQTTAVDANGDWSLELTADQTGQLVTGQDGTTLDITANLSDAAGNPAPEDTRSVDVDLTAPTVTIDALPLGGDGLLNIAESGTDLDITGTADGTNEVTVTIDGNAQPAAPVAGDGTWTVTIPAATLGGLPADATVDVTATGIDAAGNTGEASTSFDTDLAAPDVTIDTVSAGDTLTVDELADGLTVAGTASPDTAGNDVTVTIDGNDFTGAVQNDGSWTVALDEAQLTGLNLDDETEFDLSATVSDGAGNPSAPATQTLTTDFQPIVTIDPIGENGAVDLSDLGTPQITGTAFGVEAGRDVTVVANDPDGEILNATAPVNADGTWSLDVPQATIDELDAGETIDVTANATNAAGRAAPEANADVDVYLASVFSVVNTAQDGQTLTMSAIAGEGLNSNDGVETTMTFDTGEVTYVSGSTENNFDLFIVNDDDAASGSVIFSGGTATNLLAEGDVMYRFDGTDQGAGPITLGFTDAEQGGPTELQIGTADADTLTSGNTDSVLQGKAGDDTLDVSDTGANVVLFQPDQGANGTDTVTGFTTGDTFQADVIAFAGQADLRGNGDTVEALGDGDMLGADTGFVIFTTALADTAAGTLETSFEGLTGEATGDTVYFLAGDGDDAAIVRADVNGQDDADVEVIGEFEGIGDLAALNTDNVVLPDPVMNS